MSLSKSIKVKAGLTIEDAFEQLKKDGDLPAEPYTHKGVVGASVIFIPGAGHNDIMISIRKEKMSLLETQRPKGIMKDMGKDMAVDLLTRGWGSTLLKPSNKKLFEQVLATCKQLFGV